MKAEFVWKDWAWGTKRVGVRKVLCSDGVRRYARLTAEPDTYFSIPASVNVGGKTVSGFVWSADEGDVRFTASANGKHFMLLPSWPQKKVA